MKEMGDIDIEDIIDEDLIKISREKYLEVATTKNKLERKLSKKGIRLVYYRIGDEVIWIIEP